MGGKINKIKRNRKTPWAEFNDPRLDRIVKLMITWSGGDLKARVFPSKRGDELDAIITGLNMLGEELQAAVNERSRIEKELKKEKSSLELKVSSRTKNLNQANEKLNKKIAELEKLHQDLSSNEEKYRQLFENESHAVMIFDAGTLQFEDANQAALKMLGYSKEEFRRLKVFEISAEKDKTASSTAKIKTGKIKGEIVPLRHLIRKDGTVFPGELYLGSFMAGKRKKIIGAVLDITKRKNAEEKLELAYEYLDTILLNLPVGVAILEGPEFRYFKINKMLADLNGVSVKDHIGKTVAEVLPQAAEHIVPNLQKVLKSGESIINREFVVRLPKNPKAVLHLLDSFFPIKIDGKVKAVGVVVLDITNRKKAEEQIKFLKEYNENIVANIPSSILIFDKNFKCISANKCFYQQWKKKIGNVEGKTISKIFSDGPVWREKLLEVFKSSEIIEEGELKYTKSTGKKKILNIKYVPLHKESVGSGDYVMVIIDDITKKAKLQEELELTKEKLEERTKRLKSRMGKRTDQLKHINQELEDLSLAKSEFMADVSHQLRTPLTIIRSNVDLALKNKSNKRPDDYQEALQDIGAETDNINKIISDLLILVKADSGQLKLNFEPIALDALVNKIYHQIKILGDDREIVLKHVDQVNILGDESKISQIILNLLDNALKYTRPGDKIKISLYKKTRWAKVIVADTGPGIAPKDLAHIFERFYQGDTNKPKKISGSGLGLAIAQNIVKMHGGDIEVKSQLGKGTKFSIFFPIVISEQ